MIPRPVRERHKLRAGDSFLLFELSNGDIVLRRTRAPKKPLVCHLRRLKRLKLNRQIETIREATW